MALTATDEQAVETPSVRSALMTTLGKWYIPVGTDAQAVQDAIDAANAASGGVVRLLPGVTYTFRNVELKGRVIIEAYGATVIYGGDFGTVAPLEDVPVIFWAEGAEEALLEGIAVLGGAYIGPREGDDWSPTAGPSEASDCFQFDYCRAVIVRDTLIRDFKQDGIVFAHSPGSSARNNYIMDCGDAAMEVRAGSGYILDGNNVSRCRNIVASKPNVNDVIVTNNQGTTYAQGIIGHGSHWSISGNIIDAVAVPGFDGAGANAIEWSNQGGGVFVPEDCVGIVIDGNILRGRTNGNGIAVPFGSTTWRARDVIISNNHIECRRGVLIQYGEDVTVSANRISAGDGGGIVFSTNCTDCAANDNNINVTGTGRGIDSVVHSTVVADNRVTTETGYAIFINADAVDSLVNGNRTTTGAQIGILVNGNNTVVNGNRVVSAGGAVRIVGTNCSVTGNALVAGNAECVLVSGASTTVSGNVGTDGTQGCRVSANDCVVTGNRFTGMDFWGVNVSSGATDTIVANNNLKGNTSGAITDAGTTTVTANNVTS